MAKSLMIIGAGIEQVPAYERARERGLTVIGTDINAEAPGLALADHSIIASTRDPLETVAAVMRFSREHNIDGVMTIANDVPLTVATVANKLGLPSISMRAARIAQNKLEMKEVFVAHGVGCPLYWRVDSESELRNIINSQPSKCFVVKPIDGRGARGVLLINKGSDLHWAYAESQKWGESGLLILEEFIPGIQLSTESFILNGKIFTAAYALRNYKRLDQFAPYIIEDGGDLPAPISITLKSEIDALLLRAALAMGIDQGIVKGDIVIADDGAPMVIELAARLSGGWFASHQIPAATGIDLIDICISYSLGEKVSESKLQPSKRRATSIRYWFPKPGKIVEISGEALLKDIPGILKYGFFRNIGEIQPEVKIHPDRFGFVITEGEIISESLAIAELALSMISIETASIES